jgi:replicative DNA helicase
VSPNNNQKQQTPRSNRSSTPVALDGNDVRLMPQSLEAEMGVLGSMIIGRDVIGDVLQMLKAENFYRYDHQLIYEALLGLYNDNRPVDLVLLRDELKNRGQLEQVGDVDYLVRLCESVPSAANAMHYAEIVRNKGMLRGLISVTHEISTSAYDNQGDVAQILNDAEQKIFEVTEQSVSGQETPLSEIMQKVFDSLEERSKGITGLATGFYELDELTSGLQRSEMIVIAARPSMGKTALGLNIAEYIGADNNKAIAVFSLEMAGQQLAERMLCGRAHVDSHKLRQGMLSDEEYNLLVNAAHELSEAPIYVDDMAHLTPLELKAKARRLKMRHDIQCIVVDYLQLMYVPGSESRQQEVGVISRHLKSLARELEIPVVVMSQLNRGPEGREGHRPRMSDLRESGNIEQDADVVMLLHREDYYHNEPDYEKTNTADIIIAKQRNGPTGQIEVTWNPQWTRFSPHSQATEPFGI